MELRGNLSLDPNLHLHLLHPSVFQYGHSKDIVHGGGLIDVVAGATGDGVLVLVFGKGEKLAMLN